MSVQLGTSHTRASYALYRNLLAKPFLPVGPLSRPNYRPPHVHRQQAATHFTDCSSHCKHHGNHHEPNTRSPCFLGTPTLLPSEHASLRPHVAQPTLANSHLPTSPPCLPSFPHLSSRHCPHAACARRSLRRHGHRRSLAPRARAWLSPHSRAAPSFYPRLH